MARLKQATRRITTSDASRVGHFDWNEIERDLDGQGCAVLKRLLSADECRALAALYPDDAHFRSRVVMARHGLGRGEYKYFAYPLPELIAELRCSLSPELSPIANRWNAAMGVETRYPDDHAAFLERCHAAGQVRPT